MVGWHHQLHGHEFEQGPGDGEGQRSLVCCSPGGRKESDTTERLNSNNNINKMSSARKNGHQNFIIVVNYALLGFPGGSDRKESACDAGDPGLIPGLGRFLGRGNGTRSSILAWRIPWTEESGRLQFIGSQRAGYE